MSQETSGKIKLEEQLDKLLDEYNKGVNTEVAPFSDDISIYLNMSRDLIEAYSTEDKYVAALQLSQYSIYLQRLINRERARISWANSVINSICSKHWGEYSEYLKAEMKINLIAQENEVVRNTMKLRNHAQIRVDELDGLSFLIKHLSDVFLRGSYVKNQ